jgi:hypothetical protein
MCRVENAVFRSRLRRLRKGHGASSWDELKRYTNPRPENMREILILADGERIIRQANVATQPMLPPPASELVPPMTRMSRSPLFAEERLARRRRVQPARIPAQPNAVAT